MLTNPLRFMLVVLAFTGATGIRPAGAAEPPWDPDRVQACDRECLVATMDRYLEALLSGDPDGLPLWRGLRFTENAAAIRVGEGILWRAAVEPSSFRLYVADPVAGQVAIQTVPAVEGRPAMVAIRLRVERGRITEIEHLIERQVAPEAMELLREPRPQLLRDVAADERTSREGLLWAAHSYFDALEGDDGSIAAFADDCVRHELGYRTANNETPGRASPSPVVPAPGTPFSKLSMMSCAEQIDTLAFSFITQIEPRRVLIIDEQKGLGMLQNMVAMETFGIRNGMIHEVEVFPFVNLPYGSGNGWTPGAGQPYR